MHAVLPRSRMAACRDGQSWRSPPPGIRAETETSSTGATRFPSRSRRRKPRPLPVQSAASDLWQRRAAALCAAHAPPDGRRPDPAYRAGDRRAFGAVGLAARAGRGEAAPDDPERGRLGCRSAAGCWGGGLGARTPPPRNRRAAARDGGDPGRARTCSRSLRRRMLYPLSYGAGTPLLPAQGPVRKAVGRGRVMNTLFESGP